VIGILGLLLLDLGYLVLTTVERPRRLLARLVGRSKDAVAQGEGGASVRQS
jgi:hypothetical protein